MKSVRLKRQYLVIFNLGGEIRGPGPARRAREIGGSVRRPRGASRRLPRYPLISGQFKGPTVQKLTP